MDKEILTLAHEALVLHDTNVKDDSEVVLLASRIESDHFMGLCELATCLGMSDELGSLLESKLPTDLRPFLTRLTDTLRTRVAQEAEQISSTLSSSLLTTIRLNGHMIGRSDFENWFSTAFQDPFGDVNVRIGNEYQRISNTLDYLYLSVTTKSKALVHLPYSNDPFVYSVMHQWKSQGIEALVTTNGLEAMSLLDCYTMLLDYLGTRIGEADSSDNLWSIIQAEGFLEDYCIGGYSQEDITDRYRPFVDDIWCECVNQLDHPDPTWLSRWLETAIKPLKDDSLTLVSSHYPIHLCLDNDYLFHVFSDEVDGELNTEPQSRFILDPKVAVETLASVSINRCLLGLALSLPNLLTRAT